MNQKKKLTTISVVIGLICTLLILFCTYNVIKGSMFNIPLFEMALGEEEVESTKETLELFADKAMEATDEEKEELEEITGIDFEKSINLLRSPSISTLTRFGKIEELGVDSETLDIIDIFSNVILVYGLIIAFLSLLGAVFKNRAFTIISMIVSVPFFIFLAGVIYLAIFVALCIAHIVFVAKAKKAQ